MKKILLSTICTVSLLLTSGCTPKLGGSDYSLADVGTASYSYPGTITNVRVVNINATKANEPGIGAGVGAVAGGVLGSMIGGGKGQILAATAGALAGGFGGHAAEQAITAQQGFEYTVKLDDGRIMTVAQGSDIKLERGQRVMVVVNDKSSSQEARTRVIPA